MSRIHRNQRTLKNSLYLSPNQSCKKNSVTPYNISLQILLLAIIVLPIAPPRAYPEETPQWRRTKDGWIDMTEELRPLNRTPIEYSYSLWSAVWPTAATLCISFTAYWLLTFESHSIHRKKVKKNPEDSLGRLIRQTSDLSSRLALIGPNGELPIPLPILDEKHPHPTSRTTTN